LDITFARGICWDLVMDKPIETVRLILRPFEEDDLREAFAWFGDPLAMRFTPTGPDLDMAQTAARISTYRQHQTEHGFSNGLSPTATQAGQLATLVCCSLLNTTGLILDIG
jgi:hypothetical protein